jgi:cardiolipin synthase
MFGFDQFTLGTLAHLAVAIPVCCHILLTKDSESVALGWMALVLSAPFVGSGIYWVFGINRLALQRSGSPLRRSSRGFAPRRNGDDEASALLRYASAIHELPFLRGNHVEPLVNGEKAYPAMLAAIERAAASIAFSVYIFDYDAVGERFIGALAAARKRGVTVRVLVDDIGLMYSRRAVDGLLRKAGVTTARFAPKLGSFLRLINLRNHRKILVVDGREAFIGGMNIRYKHLVRGNDPDPVQDIHFRVTGPVVDQINGVFAEDWLFAAGESIVLPGWKADGARQGDVLARIVPDGPDDYFEKIEWLILGALAVSRRHVRIMTPYFLPNRVVSRALMVAALRGVEVEVVVPAKSNLPLIDWAMRVTFERLMERGVKIYASSLPFDHSKLFVVDDGWAMVGSSNWDQRSFRLNFEINLECYDGAFVAQIQNYFQRKKAAAKPLDLEAFRRLSLAARIRNNLVHLFSPYL